MAIVRRHVWISGRVQGVWFRQHTQRAAARYGLSGWVRNLPDGREEAVFEGPEASMTRMLAWCYRGPETAEVSDVSVAEEIPLGESGFQVTVFPSGQRPGDGH